MTGRQLGFIVGLGVVLLVLWLSMGGDPGVLGMVLG